MKEKWLAELGILYQDQINCEILKLSMFKSEQIPDSDIQKAYERLRNKVN